MYLHVGSRNSYMYSRTCTVGLLSAFLWWDNMRSGTFAGPQILCFSPSRPPSPRSCAETKQLKQPQYATAHQRTSKMSSDEESISGEEATSEEEEVEQQVVTKKKRKSKKKVRCWLETRHASCLLCSRLPSVGLIHYRMTSLFRWK